MRILVVSDTHGDFHSLNRAVKAQPTAELIIHCGDGASQVDELRMMYPDKKIVAVRGNCDWGSMLPNFEVVEFGGKTIFVTHGHLYNVKLVLYPLICAARENKADIALFGHTHSAMTDYEDGLTVMNPGSCHGYGASYGYIDITDRGDVVTNIVKL